MSDLDSRRTVTGETVAGSRTRIIATPACFPESVLVRVRKIADSYPGEAEIVVGGELLAELQPKD